PSSPGPSHSPSHPPLAGNVAWTDCGGRFQRGTLQVPLDYDHPDARKISLALIRIKVKDQANRIGSLLMNPGGPGESGIEFLRSDLSSLSNLNRRFDLVTCAPRGDAVSTPATCVDDPQQVAYLAIDSVRARPRGK